MATGALKCICNQQECDVIRAEDCPGKGITLWDPCKWVYTENTTSLRVV